MQKIKDIASLIRVHQWLKNGFVFLPIIFDGKIFDISYIIPTVIIFFSFCFVASSIYCLNDIIDIEADKRHPQKKKRAIASGRVPQSSALVVMVFCLCIGLLFPLLTYLPTYLPTYCVLVGYCLLNVLYCLKLKPIAILDVFIIALGFVLRVIAGGVCTGIELTPWIILMTFLLALFLAFAKRRDDVVIYNSSGDIMRKNIESYNLVFLDQIITIVATLSMVCYLMYSMSTDVIERLGSYSYLTVIFVMAGFIRYLQLTIVRERSGSPTQVLMRDSFIQICVVLWGITFGVLIYCIR